MGSGSSNALQQAVEDPYEPDKVKAAFTLLDTDGDGKITEADFGTLALCLQQLYTAEQATLGPPPDSLITKEAIFKHADTKENGKSVEIAEFEVYLQTYNGVLHKTVAKGIKKGSRKALRLEQAQNPAPKKPAKKRSKTGSAWNAVSSGISEGFTAFGDVVVDGWNDFGDGLGDVGGGGGCGGGDDGTSSFTFTLTCPGGGGGGCGGGGGGD